MKHKPLWLKWILCLSPATVGLAMYLILPHFPKLTEYAVSRGIFRIAAFPAQWVMSLFPFSVTEVVVVLAFPALIALLTVFTMRMVKSRSRLKTAEKGLRFLSLCLSLALFIFMLMDGANFSRIPLGDLMELPDRSYTAEDLYELTRTLAESASEARESLPEASDGCTALSVELSELLKLADDCYDSIADEYPFLKTGVWRVKSVALSHLWSYTGYTGVYCPWLSEASINTDVPACDLGHTAAHEVAHTIGFAREDECNFIAWLACAESSQPDFAYSGHLQAYIYCSNALHKADKELWRKAAAYCSEGVLRDLKQRNAYWASFEGEVMNSSQEFNDSFIKANGVESGTLSYNEMVALMLRYKDKTAS